MSKNHLQNLESHYNWLLEKAYSLTRNKANAEDLTHDTFVKAFVSIESYTESNFKGWLYTIMYNTFINNVKRDKHRYDLEMLDKDVVSKPFDMIDFNRIQKDLEQFKELRLRSQGYHYKELAEMFNVPIGTIKTRIWWQRKRLSVYDTR